MFLHTETVNEYDKNMSYAEKEIVQNIKEM